jgi:hypothetical protein
MENNKEIEALNAFFKSRKSVLRMDRFAFECGVGRSTFYKVLSGDITATTAVINKIKMNAQRYGYGGAIEL